MLTVGTVIQVRPDLQDSNFLYQIATNSDMVSLKGQYGKITSVQDYGHIIYHIDIDPEEYYWTEDLFVSKHNTTNIF